MNEELPRIQEQVYYGNIDSLTNVLDKFLSESGVRRYNPQVINQAMSMHSLLETRNFTSMCVVHTHVFQNIAAPFIKH